MNHPFARRAGMAVRVLALTVLVIACAPNEANQRANRWMDPGSIVGPESDQWDTPARFLRGKSPIYPINQALNGKASRAEVEFTIGIDGRTKDIRIVQADREVFGRHLAAAVRDWQFEPAERNGIPVTSAMRFTMNFSIEGRDKDRLSPEDQRARAKWR